MGRFAPLGAREQTPSLLQRVESDTPCWKPEAEGQDSAAPGSAGTQAPFLPPVFLTSAAVQGPRLWRFWRRHAAQTKATGAAARRGLNPLAYTQFGSMASTPTPPALSPPGASVTTSLRSFDSPQQHFWIVEASIMTTLTSN